MALAAGTRLGHYDILEPIGAGGMGEVYKGRDSRLNRAVAIKILPAQFASDPQRRTRFEREAHAVAALSHPNVVSIFDFDITSQPPYAVTELLEGQTLREALGRGALPWRRAADWGRQIALGLAAAHAKGIVHRDLKPENVFITVEGRAKVLDFGLAKAQPEPESGVSPSEAQTASHVTREGAVLGTVPYMSPEQARGESADARSDIFALGAILYEMLAGRRPFPGPSLAETLAAILGPEPPALAASNVDIPTGLDRIVMRCLAKRREDRFQSARDLAFALESLAEAPAATAGEGARGSRLWRAGVVLATFLGLAVGALLQSTWQASAPEREPVLRLRLPLPEGTTLEDYASASLAVSPAGDKLAFVAKRGGTARLYVRTLDAESTQELAGTEGASSPFFSPDGQWLAFESGARVRKVPLAGGTAQTIAAAPFFSGGVWGPGEVVVFVPTATSGLWRVAAGGGATERLTALDKARGEGAHLWPDLAASGRDVLFTVWTGASFDEARLALLSLDSGRYDVLLENAYFGRFAGPERILFARGGGVFGIAYDPRRQRVRGAPYLVQEGVLSETTNGFALFAASPKALFHAFGPSRSPQRSLVFVDRRGQESPAATVVRGFSAARLSPTDERIATSVDGESPSLWMWTPRTQALTRFAFSPDDHSVAWSPDSRRVAFESGRDGTHAIFVGPADGAGEDERATRGDRDQYLCDWSPDGRLLAFTQFNAETGADVYLTEPGGEEPPRPFTATRFFERKAAFSPDGRYLAYVSDESGRDEVYVRPLRGEGRVQVSVDGGAEPAWSYSGKEIFFRGSDHVMAARVDHDLDFQAPVALFPDRYFFNKFQTRSYDVGRDGRFLMIKPTDESPVAELRVVAGWSRRSPATRAAELTRAR
jgi:serine/threonine-protein kinase